MLTNLQRQFKNALFNHLDDDILFVLSKNSKQRFNVYRQTVIENLRRALEITYPGIWKLLGNECANNIAQLYFYNKSNLPISGCLDDWGEHFASFLEAIPSLQSLIYLKDYANYEWCKQLSLAANVTFNLSIKTLENYSEEELEQLQFEFQPSVQLFHSNFPIQAIEAMLDNPDNLTVKLDQGKSFGIIVKIDNTVQTFWVKENEWAFLVLLKKDERLKEAYRTIKNQYLDFNLIKTIAFIFHIQSIKTLKLCRNEHE